MSKKFRNIIIVIAVLTLAFIVYTIIRNSLREEADFTFPDSIEVKSNTELDPSKIAKIIAYNLFEFDTIKLVITNMPPNLENVGDMRLLAYVTKNPFEPHHYFIFLSKQINPSELKKTISHEMIHVKQMEKGDLIQSAPNYPWAVWKGDTIKYMEIPYEKRPHEIEAHKLDDRVLRDLEEILYK